MNHRLVLLGLLVGLIGGCAFGTNRVSVVQAPPSPLPQDGPATDLVVVDARPDASGGVVGFKRNGYGGKTGTVALPEGHLLADLIRADLVSLLRQKGYVVGGTGQPNFLRVDARVRSLLIDSKVGFWTVGLEGVGVVELTLSDPRTHRTYWSEVVRSDVRKSAGMAVTAGDHDAVFDALHADLLARLASAIPPPPVRALAAGASLSNDSVESRLLELKRLYEEGLISGPEFERKRAELVDAL